jgi:glycosyltransferase involved in cell wall biosynthesis
MKRLLILHFAGDFRAAWRRREAGGTETYSGHGYILDELARIAASHGDVGYLSCLAPPYHEKLPNGVTVLGAGVRPGVRPRTVLCRIREFAPTHLIVHGPMPRFIRWGLRRGLCTGVVFADSFATHPVYRWLRFGRLATLLNKPEITLVANHGMNAARGLVALGVDPAKVIAWDFPHPRTPDRFPVKSGVGGQPFQLLYVGSLERKKGIGDLLAAVARLSGTLDVQLRLVGSGQRERFAAMAKRLGITDRVEFMGVVANSEVPALMHAADAVAVPSRHEFPEGLPLTLFEALASRTPVVASDHPMFSGHLVDGASALVFPARDVAALARAVARLASDPELYARLSAGGEAAWYRMQVPVKWGEMIERWLSETPADRAWLADCAIGTADPAAAGINLDLAFPDGMDRT